MSDKEDKISAVFADRATLEKALAQAIRKALLAHKRAGNPVAVERKGKVVEILPEEIPDLPSRTEQGGICQWREFLAITWSR